MSEQEQIHPKSNHGKVLKIIAIVIGIVVGLSALVTPAILSFIDRGAKQEIFKQHQKEMMEYKTESKEFKKEIAADIRELKNELKERIAENRKMIRDLEKKQ